MKQSFLHTLKNYLAETNSFSDLKNIVWGVGIETNICKCACLCVYAESRDFGSSSKVPLTSFWDRMSHCTWSLLLQLGWLASQLQDLPVSASQSCDQDIHGYAWLLNGWWGFKCRSYLCRKYFYPQSHLLNDHFCRIIYT